MVSNGENQDGAFQIICIVPSISHLGAWVMGCWDGGGAFGNALLRIKGEHQKRRQDKNMVTIPHMCFSAGSERSVGRSACLSTYHIMRR